MMREKCNGKHLQNKNSNIPRCPRFIIILGSLIIESFCKMEVLRI